jgi:hypothetical protein
MMYTGAGLKESVMKTLNFRSEISLQEVFGTTKRANEIVVAVRLGHEDANRLDPLDVIAITSGQEANTRKMAGYAKVVSVQKISIEEFESRGLPDLAIDIFKAKKIVADMQKFHGDKVAGTSIISVLVFTPIANKSPD